MNTLEELEKRRKNINDRIPFGKANLVKRLEQIENLKAETKEVFEEALIQGQKSFNGGKLEEAQKFWVIALSTAEMTKSYATSDFTLMANKIGKSIQHQWPEANEPFAEKISNDTQDIAFELPRKRQCRLTLSAVSTALPYFKSQDEGSTINESVLYRRKGSKPSLSNFVVVNYCIQGEDLVIFLDGKIEQFIFGDGFTDYEYNLEKIKSSTFLCPPIIIRNAKNIVNKTIDLLTSFKDDHSEATSFTEIITELSKLLAIPAIDEAITLHCKSIGLPSNELNLIIIPEGVLYHVPFNFLKSNGQSLFNKFASISIGLNLMSLKWQIMEYLWECLPKIPLKNPRCLFVGVPSTKEDASLPYLSGVKEEWVNLQEIFGENKVLGFGDTQIDTSRASLANIATYHKDAEIFWFSGHGIEQKDTPDGEFVLPNIGLVLPEETLSVNMLYGGDPWNFNSVWMVVLNACLVGRLKENRSEMLGFNSGLYLTGATAIVNCLWSVEDDVAVDFEKVFAKYLLDGYQMHDLEKEFVRSKAFNSTLKTLSKQYSDESLSCYQYFGVP